MSCPIKTDPSWVKLNKILGDEQAAYKVWGAHNGSLPRIDSPTEIRKRIKFKYGPISNLQVAIIQKQLSIYNKDYNTSHRLETDIASGSSYSAKLVVNYMPSLRNFIYDERTTQVINTVEDGDESIDVVVTKAVSDIIVQEGNQYIVDGEVYPSYEDARNSLFENEFQLRASGVASENFELNELMEDILAKQGISVEYIDDFKERYGVDGVAVADMLNKMVYVANGKAGLDTLPEETAHFIMALLGENHPLYKAAYKVITSTTEYQQVKEEYFTQYKGNEDLLKQEAMGKVLAQYFIKRFEAKEALPVPVKSIFERIFNWFNNIFKKVDNTQLQSKLDEVFGTIANQTFSGDLKVTTDDLGQDNLFSLESATTAAKTAVAKLKQEREKLRRRATTEKGMDDLNTIERAIAVIDRKIEHGMITDAITGFMDYSIRNELNHLVRFRNEYISGNDTTIPEPYVVNNMRAVIQLHGGIIRDMRNVLEKDNDPVLKEYFNNRMVKNVGKVSLGGVTPDEVTVREQFDGAFSMISILSDFLNDIELRSGAEALAKNDNYQHSTEYYMEILKSTIGDTNGIVNMFTPMFTSNDAITRVVYKIINDVYNETHREVFNRSAKLRDLQIEMEKAGFNDMTMFHEKDANGNPTGYILAEHKWGEYAIERDKMHAAVEALFGESFYDIDIYTLRRSDEPANKELVKKYDELVKAFRKKYEYFDSTTGTYHAQPLVNEEYKRVINLHPTVKAYYDELLKRHMDTKALLPKAQRTGPNKYLVPQITKNVAQLIKYSDNTLMKQLWGKTKESFIKTNMDTEFGDTGGDVHASNGSAIKTVPMYYTKKLDDMKMLSNDFTTMYALFDEMATNFRALMEKQEDIELVLRLMGERSVYKTAKDKEKEESGAATGLSKKGAETADYKRLIDFLDMHMFSREKKDIKVKLKDKEIDVTKAGYKLISYLRDRNLFMQIFTIASGFIKSNIDSLLEDVYGEFSTFESKRWATLELTKLSKEYLLETGKRAKTNKVDAMFGYFGIIGNIKELFDKLDIDNALGRVGKEEIIYSGYTQVSLMTKGTFVLSLLDNYRLVNGKFIRKSEFTKLINDGQKLGAWSDYKDKTLYEAYDVVNGSFKVKDEYKKYVTKEFENFIHGVIKNRTAVIEGTLNRIDKGAIFNNFLGQALMMHRSWMVSSITEGFKKKHLNPITGMEEEGFRRTGIKYIWGSAGMLYKAFSAKGLTFKQKLALIKFRELEGYERQNIFKLAVDMSAMAVLAAFTYVVHQAFKDDDEDEWWTRALCYLATRAYMEQSAMYNIKEFTGILNSPSAATSIFDTTDTLFKSFLHNSEIEYGAYEGMTQREKALIQLSLLKNMFELQHPEQKDKYLLNQIL